MLTSPRAVREISRSSILAEQTRLIALGRAVTVLIRHLEELYQPAPLRSGPSSSRAVSLHRVAAAMVVTLAAGLLPRLAQAQAVVADGPGTTLPATGTIITLPGTTALHALNGGTITGTPPLTVNTRGGAQAVLADSGGMINITGSPPTSITSEFIGVEANGVSSTATVQNFTITTTGPGASGSNNYGALALDGGVLNLTDGTITRPFPKITGSLPTTRLAKSPLPMSRSIPAGSLRTPRRLTTAGI
jgi:hypothetical protein